MTRLRLLLLSLLLLLTVAPLLGASAAPPEPLSTLNPEATVTVSILDMGPTFGQVDGWESALYAGAVVGEETDGRFTEWMTVTVPVIDTNVTVFDLPDDVLVGETAPFGEPNNTYVRVRSAGMGTYPTFDLLSEPFTLWDGFFEATFFFFSDVTTEAGTADMATVTISMLDLTPGSDFGDPGDWEAALYTGPMAGQEEDGQFTNFVAAVSDVVTFTLPADIITNNGPIDPWDQTIYARIRTPQNGVAANTFDYVSQPFTLAMDNDYAVTTAIGRQVVPANAVYLPGILRNATPEDMTQPDTMD